MRVWPSETRCSTASRIPIGSSAALSTRLAVSSFTSARVSSLSALDTVAGWTPATRATSRSVTAAPGLTFEIAIHEIMHSFAAGTDDIARGLGARAAPAPGLPGRVDGPRGLPARDLDEHRGRGHRDRGAVRLPDADRPRPDREQRAGRAAGARHGVDGRHRRPKAFRERVAELDAPV